MLRVPGTYLYQFSLMWLVHIFAIEFAIGKPILWAHSHVSCTHNTVNLASMLSGSLKDNSGITRLKGVEKACIPNKQYLLISKSKSDVRIYYITPRDCKTEI